VQTGGVDEEKNLQPHAGGRANGNPRQRRSGWNAERNQGREEGLTSKYVFTYARRTIDRVDRAFRAALKRAHIEDFRFHDLRHTAASHMVMRGASLKEIQEILGHTTMTMTLRYAHLGEEQKKRAVGLLNGLTSSIKSDMSQSVTSAPSTEIEPTVTY
jgi:integrase